MQVRQLILTASAFVIASAGPAHAQNSAPVAGDSVLQSLVAEALARNPTVAQRQAAVRAATLRIRPAGSLPDPMLSVGVMDLLPPNFAFNQSDFTEVDAELSPEIPWPGTLGAVNALRNRTPGDSLGVVPVDPAQVRAGISPLPPSDSLIALALVAHPRLAARRAAVDQATRTIQVERLGARPDFTLTARYGYRPPFLGQFPFPGFFSAFVGLRLPIWAWRKQSRLAETARADSTGPTPELRDAQLQLSREVTEAAARVQASQQRLAL